MGLCEAEGNHILEALLDVLQDLELELSSGGCNGLGVRVEARLCLTDPELGFEMIQRREQE